MTFFESLLVLLLAAIALLQVARRLSLPYPAMLAGAGVIVALIPGAPTIPIEPSTYLALFMAPALVDAAYDFPPGATRRFLSPLITFAVVAVILTTGVVALIGTTFLGLPVAAAIALGAIVAPPDAAAATAVLRNLSIPRSADAVLKGESLFNDATALLLFGGALTVLSSGGFRFSTGVRLGLAVPGGLLLGIVCAYLARYVNRRVRGTLGGNLLQFCCFYFERVRIPAFGYASTIHHRQDAGVSSPRSRGVRGPHCARSCMHAFGRRHRLQSSGGMVGVVTPQACARHCRPGFVRRVVRDARVRYHGHGVRFAQFFPAT
jgi:hypothetical protein